MADKEYNFKIIIEEGGYYAKSPAFQGCHVEADMTIRVGSRKIFSFIFK
ncbi:MAG: hypothetical protein ABUK01_09810 [Leptospirales bacterium]